MITLACAKFHECRLEVQFLFVDQPVSASPERFQSALELHERAEMLSEMPVCVQHVALEEERVGVRLLAPVIIADPLEGLSCLAADCEEPAVAFQRNVLQRVPDILPKRRVLQKTPIFGFS